MTFLQWKYFLRMYLTWWQSSCFFPSKLIFCFCLTCDRNITFYIKVIFLYGMSPSIFYLLCWLLMDFSIMIAILIATPAIFPFSCLTTLSVWERQTSYYPLFLCCYFPIFFLPWHLFSPISFPSVLYNPFAFLPFQCNLFSTVSARTRYVCKRITFYSILGLFVSKICASFYGQFKLVAINSIHTVSTLLWAFLWRPPSFGTPFSQS